MQENHTRREWLKTVSAVSSVCLARSSSVRAASAPTAPVTVAKCKDYGAELLPTLARMFDQLGGLGRLVKGKTVGVKINLTGAPFYRLAHEPLGDTHYTSPQVIAATVHLMGRAGAKRIRLIESLAECSARDPMEEFLLQANWEPRDILNAAANVEFENTNCLGKGKRYSRFKVPSGGYIFPAYDLNHSYEDCDVFVSLAKMKEHATAGITLSIKNCLGLTPCSIYGVGAGVDEPNEFPKGSRSMMHSGNRQPSKSSPSERDPASPREGGYRIPRVIVDLVSARPIDLAIVEGVKSMTGGEGPWIRGPLAPASPGVIVAGTNPVTTDAVCMAVMGFDPMADRDTPPFENCDSTLRLAEDVGIGTRDLNRIEVIGTPIKDALFDFAAIRRQRRLSSPSREGRKNQGHEILRLYATDSYHVNNRGHCCPVNGLVTIDNFGENELRAYSACRDLNADELQGAPFPAADCVAFATANAAADPGVCVPAGRVAWNSRVNDFSSREGICF